MENKITLKDFDKICRFCLIFGFGEELQCVFELDVSKIFTRLTDIELKKDDNLPENICKTCTKHFDDFSQFVNKCKNNYETLKTLQIECKLKNEDDFNNFDVTNENDVSSEEETKNIKTDDVINATDQTEQRKIKSKKPTETEKTTKKTLVLKCENCQLDFPDKSKLNGHFKENPSCVPKDYKCFECNKAFNKKYKLTAHMRSHTKEEPFECGVCFKTFRFSQNLRRHRLIHKGIKPFKCEVCGKEFSRAHVRNEHMNIHTGNNPYICTYCGKGFKRYANHFIHVYRHKLINGEVQKNDDRKLYLQLECEICHKIFASRGGLANHLTLHKDEPRQRAYLCNDCGKGFVTHSQLESHSRVHSGVKPYECKDCNRKFRQKSALNTHQLLHSGRKPHKCEICQKFFTQSGHLKVHMRTHSGEKPYNCKFCGKCFALKSNLKVHTRIHTGETPYICSVCNMGFYDSSTLKKHSKAHATTEKNLAEQESKLTAQEENIIKEKNGE